MVATSAHHVVRVTVRVSVVAFHRDIDVTLPTSSTLAEVLPELARLVELPEVHRPWQATTAGGDAIFDLVITGSLLAIIPLIALFLLLQRFWQSGLAAGSVKE